MKRWTKIIVALKLVAGFDDLRNDEYEN